MDWSTPIAFQTFSLLGGIILLTTCAAPSGEPGGAMLASGIIHHAPFLPSPNSLHSRHWQDGLGLTYDPDKDSIWHEPVQYYISDPSCSPLARDFYYGTFRPTDNDSTRQLLELAVTENPRLRPFYRWCLNKTIQIQDGALCEYTGVPARRYAEQYPEECLDYLAADSSGVRYQRWTSAIAYSGAYPDEIKASLWSKRRDFLRTMQQNCISCNEEMKRRLNDFAADCF